MSERRALLSIKLNDAQREAVQTIEGPLLCIAGAGTGKTATLTARVAYMIEQGIVPGSILLLTFTRKAAKEMLDRAARVFGQACYEVEGGTFHSFAFKLLKKYGEAVGLKRFNIIDQADVEEIIGYEMEALKVSGALPAKNLARVMFGKAVNWGMTLEAVLRKDYPEYEGCLEELENLRTEVDWYKIEHGLVDYDDLLVYTQKLLEDRPEITSNLSFRHQFIMIDEYQDTNAMQSMIVRLLCMEHENIMAVGNDAQSIYAFRGANYRNIFDFPKHFPETKIIRLEENFRSVQPVLNMTNAVIGQAKEAFRKNLYSHRPGGVLPQMVYCQDEQEQSQHVVTRIQSLLSEGMSLNDMAVLVRSSFHSYDLELELNTARIPFVKVGGLKFMETRHVKDVLAYLRVLMNINDSLAWMRILTLFEGLGPKTAQKIFKQLLEAEQPFHWLAECPLKGKWRDEVCKLGQLLLAVLPYGPAEQLEQIIAHYLPYLREVEDSDQEYFRRQEGLNNLIAMAVPYHDTLEFLTNIMLDPPNESTNIPSDNPEEQPPLLTLSTIHSAKGLECKVVFILWLTEGRFPSLYTYEHEERLEEELRLLYVAMTRAKDELHLCTPAYYDHRAGMTFSQVSSFLKDVPEALYQYRSGSNGNGSRRLQAVAAAPEW